MLTFLINCIQGVRAMSLRILSYDTLTELFMAEGPGIPGSVASSVITGTLPLLFCIHAPVEFVGLLFQPLLL
jgi:hypothetical protein